MMEVRIKPDYIAASVDGHAFAQSVRGDLSSLKAFTLAPDPKRYPTVDPTGQYKCLLNCLFCKMDIRKVFSKFLFTPELTEEGNIHIHGYYIVSDPVKYHKWFVPACKSIGYVKIKTNVDKEWTENYVIKDMNKMEDILGSDVPIPLCTDNYKDYRKVHDFLKKQISRYKINKTKKVKNIDIRKFL